MIMGIFLIIAGVLIAVFPALLSFIVAVFFIFWGAIFVYLSFHYRKVTHKFEDPFIDFFFRF